MLRNAIVVTTLTGAAWVSGWIPNFSTQSQQWTMGRAALAQNQPQPTAEEISKFAKISLTIEPKRLQTLKELEERLGKKAPVIVCHKPETLEALPSSSRDVVINYCNEAKKISESQGLPASQFNRIWMQVQQDPQLKERVTKAICRIQPEICNRST